MTTTPLPLSQLFAVLLDRLRASKAGHFVAPRPSELAPGATAKGLGVEDDPHQLYGSLPTRWGIDEPTYVPSVAPWPSEPNLRSMSRDEHRDRRHRAERPASSKITPSGSFRLFD